MLKNQIKSRTKLNYNKTNLEINLQDNNSFGANITEEEYVIE